MRDKKSGQSLIEFSFVSILFIFMLSLTYNAVIGFAVYQYVSYATFMSARAYQASRENPDQQKSAAIAALMDYLPGYNGQEGSDLTQGLSFGNFRATNVRAVLHSVEIPDPQINVDYGPASVFPGSRRSINVSIEVPLVQLPLTDEMRVFRTLRLESRSFLGREVSTTECRQFFRSFLDSYRIPGNPLQHGAAMSNLASDMEDGGC